MANLNRVTAIGHLGNDPEIRFTPKGTAVGKFSIAVNEKWRDQAGNQQQHTEWINVEVWGKMAENCGQYLSKGKPVYIEGRLRTDKYQDKQGIDRHFTKVIASTIQFLGRFPQTRAHPGPGEDFNWDKGPAEDDDMSF